VSLLPRRSPVFVSLCVCASAFVSAGLTVPACGGSAVAQPSPASGGAAPTALGTADPTGSPSAAGQGVSARPAPPAEPPSALPSRCANASSDLCVPPPAFAERLCTKPHQDVALALFAKSSPFTRLYLKGRVDELAFDEEVLAVRLHEQAKGGMIVGSGNGTYDVLRWDGSCAMGVEVEVFTRARPPRPRTAHIQWHRVGEATQNALIASSEAVKHAHARRGKECKGAMTGDVSAACEKADASLVEAIATYVRAGGELPAADPP
jgi:hypothetical protein